MLKLKTARAAKYRNKINELFTYFVSLLILLVIFLPFF